MIVVSPGSVLFTIPSRETSIFGLVDSKTASEETSLVVPSEKVARTRTVISFSGWIRYFSAGVTIKFLQGWRAGGIAFEALGDPVAQEAVFVAVHAEARPPFMSDLAGRLEEEEARLGMMRVGASAEHAAGEGVEIERFILRRAGRA